MKICWVAILYLFINSLSAAWAESLQPMASEAKGWVLQAAYSDEFDGLGLDQKKWNNNVGSWKTWSWKPENVAVRDGNLAITMNYLPHQRDGKDIYYTSGIVMSRKPVLYGYFEARIKGAPLYPGVCPAFWAWRKEKGLWTEIDFVEMTEHHKGPQAIETNTHVFMHPSLPETKQVHEGRLYNAPWDPREDFHVYGCEWDATEIRWYIDGKLVAKRSNEYWHQPLDLTLSMGLRPPLSKVSSAEGFPTTFLIDYVRVWQRPIG